MVRMNEITIGVATRGVNCHIFFTFGRAGAHGAGSTSVDTDCKGTGLLSILIAFTRGYLLMRQVAKEEYRKSEVD